jgi:hypothetical protein
MAQNLYNYTAVVLDRVNTDGSIILIYCPDTKRIVAGSEPMLHYKELGGVLAELFMQGWKETKREVL